MQIFQVDAFTNKVFGGNPAAVVPLDNWLPDATMQAIAAENNLAETAFFVLKSPGKYELRWFTPELEIDLCGHATLASAHVLYNHLGETSPELRFETKSGELIVVHEDDWLSMDFPARPPSPRPEDRDLLTAALNMAIPPLFVGKSRDYLVELGSESAVRALRPRMDLVAKLDCIGVIATAPGDTVDFVSRFFAPQAGVPEDPVTGSAHSTLIPFWGGKLGQFSLDAWQVSPRHGVLRCTNQGDRVTMAGQAVTYLVGEIGGM